MEQPKQPIDAYTSACSGSASKVSESRWDVIDNNLMIKIAGKSYRCECGANVFSKLRGPFPDGDDRYQCNGCETTYASEPA
jgi:predicted SprT family Zn-dependent metalloprotease